MVQRRRDLGLLLERANLIRRQMLRQRAFQCDVAFEFRLLDQQHFAGASGPEMANNFVPVDMFDDFTVEHHGRRRRRLVRRLRRRRWGWNGDRRR